METQYQQLANNAPGASSTKKKIIGAMMIIGGIALACIGAAILAATLGFSSAASISAIAGGAGLVTAGTLTGAAGCGLIIFSRGHNAEKYMGKIAEETKKSSPK